MRPSFIAAATLTFALTLTVHLPPAQAARCSDFATQAAAQAYFDRTGDGRLDRNGDGIACENLPAGRSAAPAPAAPPSSFDPENAVSQEDWIHGEGFQGYCKVEDRVNLRSGPSTTSTVLANTGEVWRSARVHATEFHNGNLWAWSTIAFGNDRETDAWVSAEFFYECR